MTTTVNGQEVIVLSTEQCSKLRQLLNPRHANYGDQTLMLAIDLIEECASTYKPVTPAPPDCTADEVEHIGQPKWLSTEECSKIYGVLPRTVRRAVAEGRLIARREGHRLLVRAGQPWPYSMFA
jgi:hypothetical protein